jgi:hypothetical protein
MVALKVGTGMHFNNPEFIGFAMRAAFGAICVIFAWQIVYLPTTVDMFRQKIFCLRRELFLYMASGALASNHPAYTLLRTRMNGLLRFAERLTLGRMLFTAAVYSLRRCELVSETDRRFAMIEDEVVRKKMMDFDERIASQVAFQILRTSLICWLFVIPILFPVSVVICLCGGVRDLGTAMARALRSKIERQIIYAFEIESEMFSKSGRGWRDLVGG